MKAKSFNNKTLEENIYKQGRHLNKYPYDLVVSIIARSFFQIPEKDRKKIKVLDLGCGAGNNAKFFAENGFDVYGIDASRVAIEISKNRFKDCKLTANFVQGDFLHLPYEDNYFDIVLDRESLCMNNFEDVKKATQEAYNKMKKGGMFISFFYNSFHSDKEFGQMIEPNTYDNFSEKSRFYKTGIVHFIDIKEILDAWSKFKIENIVRHSGSEVYNKKIKSIEFDEYIIIAKR